MTRGNFTSWRLPVQTAGKSFRLIRHRTAPGPENRETVTNNILAELPINDTMGIILKVEADGNTYRFFAGTDENNLSSIGEPVDSCILSDEWVGKFGWGFTGTFVGVYAVDRSGARSPVDFKVFLV